MGVPKEFLAFRNSTLLERAVEVLQSAGLSVRLLTSEANRLKNATVPVIVDRIPGAGPLGAIYTALEESESPHCYCLACDTPLVEPDLFQVIMQHIEGQDAVVPVDSKGRLHPLSAYYSKSCRALAGDLLRIGHRRVGVLLEAERLRVLKLPVKAFGIPDRYFRNINTPDEYEGLLADC